MIGKVGKIGKVGHFSDRIVTVITPTKVNSELKSTKNSKKKEIEVLTNE